MVAEPQQDIVITDNKQASRYELTVDGVLASFCEYEVLERRMLLPHTVTLPEFGGRGLAARVVMFALDDARSRGLSVIPTCWYVAEYIDEHPEYADLVAR